MPLRTPHARLPILEDRGWVKLRDFYPPIAEDEYLKLQYIDWKSGGDTSFAPIATADGTLDCFGFGRVGAERSDKNGLLTCNTALCPTISSYVTSHGINFGRVRVIRLEQQCYEEALKHIHRDDNNRFNPDNEGWVVRQWLELSDNKGSFMILMEQGRDGLPDPSTEIRLPLYRGAQFVVDSQRLWHAVCHNSSEPRYALISSLESGPELQNWIEAQLP